jgi:Ni,Fe-hydrogenase I cytochrome b subunit
MEFIKKMCSRVGDLIGRLPIIGGLTNCTIENHKYALGEFFSTLFFSFSPILVAYLVAYLNNHETELWACIGSNLHNGELFLYITSLLAPVFFIVMKKRSDKNVFPSKAWHIWLYGAIVSIAAIIFALKRINFNFDPLSIIALQNLIFSISLILFYLALVYNNSLLPNPSEMMRNEEEEFSIELHEHRRRI